MADRIECVVVGAGVVGLAVARALALAGREVLLLEAETHPGTITSARNSGVIHAGLYYAPGSFKARFCVAGNRALYAYCKARGVEHHNCGKLIVANGDDEEQVLLHLLERAHANDVDGVRMISASRGAQARARSALHGGAALPDAAASSTSIPTCSRCRATWKMPAARWCAIAASRASRAPATASS